MKLQDWAAQYLERGFEIIPLYGIKRGHCTCLKGSACKAAGKHPIHSGWQKGDSATLETFKAWNGTPINIGIKTGRASGFDVLDVDGEEGKRSLNQLIHRYGPLPEGVIQITGSGGVHLLFKYGKLSKLGNAVKVFPGLDIRTDGGQIVAAPSLHVSGSNYDWSSWEADLPEVPDWLVEVLLRGVEKQETATSAFNFAKWLTEKAPISIDGENGSKSAMVVAAKAVRVALIHDFDEFREAVTDWNTRCDPPWSEDELRHKFEDALDSFDGDGLAPLPVTEKGTYPMTQRTVREILLNDSKYANKLRRNELSGQMLHVDEPVTDAYLLTIRAEIRDRYGFGNLPKEYVFDEVCEIAHKNSFNPVVEYLESLEWDGVPRLDTLAIDVLGASAEKPIFNTFIKRWLIAAVARAFEPGCTVQNALILHGGQGVGKSRFLQALAGTWFCDSFIDLKRTDAYQVIQNAWIYEWAELDILYRSSQINAVKSFVSSSEDTYRASYGRIVETRPRRCVFAGTTNEVDFLHDHTGSRRFWVIECGPEVDVVRANENRDQLWAEAFTLYGTGEQWYLTQEEEHLREEVAEDHTPERPGYDKAVEVIRQVLTTDKTEYVKFNEVAHQLGFDPSTISPINRDEISAALRDVGLVRRTVRINGKQQRVWWSFDARCT